MSIYIGRQITNDELNVYNSSNKLYLKSKTSSNLLYINYHGDSFNDGCIVFKNDYQFGYINSKLTFYNSSNLLTIDNASIISYKNVILNSNLEIINYYKTSNNINYFNNNILLNFNNNSNNSLKIKFNDTTELINITSNDTIIKTPNIHASNLYIQQDCVLYTNFIDSPNMDPVVIRNMAFAESLRIITANIVHSLKIDTRIIFNNYANLMPNDAMNLILPFDLTSWSNYLTINNINENDLFFTAPNINISKIATNEIGGSNILEFKVYNQIDATIPSKVLSINNKGYINIGDTNELNTPLFININPIHSNIIQYINKNNSNNNFSVGSNGYVSIGSSNLSPNQLSITRYNVKDTKNTDLISLNINYDNTLGIYNSADTINIKFINNDTLTDFNIIEYGYDKYVITNNFISNNIIENIYNNVNHYIEIIPIIQSIPLDSNMHITYPINGFNITSNINGNSVDIMIYPSVITIPSTFITSNYNKFIKSKIINQIPIYYNFYIYKSTFTYNYNNLNNVPYKTNTSKVLTASLNSNIVYSISSNGNVGIGTNYTDKYKLYVPENGLINNLNCSIISNYLTNNISFSSNNLNNINTINTININSCNITSISNILNNINNNYCYVNCNLNIASNAFLDVNSISSFGYSNVLSNYIINVNIPSTGNGNAISIYNQNNNINPNISLYGSNLLSYPFITFKNLVNNTIIKITTDNNFEINTSNSTSSKTYSVIYNNINKNYVSLYDNNLSIFKDNDNNVKIYVGMPKFNNNDSIPAIDWFNSISNIGLQSSYPSLNTYGDLNMRNTYNNSIITSATYNTGVNANTSYIRIGMGTTPPLSTDVYDMNVNLETNFSGNVYINSNLYISGTVLTPSDSNIKTNIKKIINPIDKISTINGYTYTRIDTGKQETGLLAQEVINILPEVITYNEITNFYNISYGNLCGLLVEGIKELNERVKTLEEKYKNNK